MLFFYIRHGDPTYQPDELTPLGRRQAEALGRRLAQFGVDRIYSSPSVRAMQTAEPLCEMLHKEKTTLDFCHEALAYEELKVETAPGQYRWACETPSLRRQLARSDVRALGKSWYEHEAFAAYRERFARCMTRVGAGCDRLLSELGYEHIDEENVYRVTHANDERVALFAHAGVGRVILSHILDIPYPMLGVHTDMTHTGMTVLEFRDEGGWCIPRLLMYSADGHLYRDGMPTLYNNRIRL